MPEKLMIAEGLRHYELLLQRTGSAGLEFLNARVPHRFTVVNHLRDGMLYIVSVFDKQGQVNAEDMKEIPLKDSFCQFVLREGSMHSANTGADHRFDGSPYQATLASYCGVPLKAADGVLFGTLCHFDYQSHVVSNEEFSFLQAAAQLLEKHFLAARSYA